ncbi:MAG: SurA N-terminal domain-containing protein [Bacteroidales bacterium]|jgi:peptidyl-prolyl cis-trans isomerase D
MAIIQSIRNRAGLLVAVIIGVALLAFLVGDFLLSGGFIYQKSKMNIAEINGKKITYPEFQKLNQHYEEILKIQYQTSSLDEDMRLGARNQAWEDLLQDNVLFREYEKLGLAVDDQEFSDLIQGPNPHQLVRQMFGDPQTGVINRLQLTEFLSRIDQLTGEQKTLWVYYEDMITKERLYTKYQSLISQGLYVNKLEAQRRQNQLNNSVDISFIQKPYTSVADSLASVSKGELNKYYKENRERFKQEESRNIRYVEFEIIPSRKDYHDAKAWIEDAYSEFEEIEDVEQYINFNSPPYDPTNYKKGELPDTLDQFMFNARVGDVYGPYFEDDAYKLAKLAKINYLPDSVRVSQIVLPVTQNNVNYMQMLADSLKTEIEKGANFARLARENSADPSAQAGGDIGWIKEGYNGQYFSDSCFYAKKGDVKITYTQNGLHIVKITDVSTPVKKVQVGILVREVIPSNETDQVYYTRAIEFATQNNTLEKFDAATKDGDPKAIPVFDMKPLDEEVPGLAGSRYIVHWAFQAEEGSIIDDIRDYGGKYVVAVLTKVSHKGYAPIENVKTDLELEIIKDKKAEIMSSEIEQAMNNTNSIDELASELNLDVHSATGIRFSSFSVPVAGNEPKLIATAVNLDLNELSSPIAGENGVYVVNVDNINDTANEFDNLQMTKNYIRRSYSNRAMRSTFQVLNEMADIKDHRANFY